MAPCHAPALRDWEKQWELSQLRWRPQVMD